MERSPQQPIPVFPLPDRVIFPHAVLPVHVFELRYRTMIRDALSRGRLLAMALLKPGYERDYHGSPEFFPIGCLARIEEIEWLPNDCYDLKLRGLARVHFDRLVREYPYRAAAVRVLPEAPCAEDDPLVQIDKQTLFEAYQRWRRARAAEPEPERVSVGTELAYNVLVNTLCMFVDCGAAQRLELLELDSVIDRSRRIRELILERLARGDPATPRGGEYN
jgi:Lon protease-like protein